MKMVRLSLKNILFKPLSAALCILLLAFGIALMILIFIAKNHFISETQKNAKGIDLVIGAKGSPLQIILCNIFHIDFPTGNIPLNKANEITQSRWVKTAIPLALGDSYQGFRIVGTTPSYIDLYQGIVEKGKWENDKKVIIGHDVHTALNLQIGDWINSTHGMAEIGMNHDESPYVISGILKKNGSVLDKLILTAVPNIWEMHASHTTSHPQNDSIFLLSKLGFSVSQHELENEEITSLLITYRSPMAALQLPRTINQNTSFQAAAPAFEIARLFEVLGNALKIVNVLAVIIILISALSVFISLLNSLKERKYEMAILRVMGAKRTQIFMMVFSEGMLLTIFGIVTGIIFSYLFFIGIAHSFQLNYTFTIFMIPEIFYILSGGIVLGSLSAIIPAFVGYFSNISNILAKE